MVRDVLVAQCSIHLLATTVPAALRLKLADENTKAYYSWLFVSKEYQNRIWSKKRRISEETDSTVYVLPLQSLWFSICYLSSAIFILGSTTAVLAKTKCR